MDRLHGCTFVLHHITTRTSHYQSSEKDVQVRLCILLPLFSVLIHLLPSPLLAESAAFSLGKPAPHPLIKWTFIRMRAPWGKDHIVIIVVRGRVK